MQLQLNPNTKKIKIVREPQAHGTSNEQEDKEVEVGRTSCHVRHRRRDPL